MVAICSIFFLFSIHRKGSVIVSFILLFITPVATNEGLAELNVAVSQGTIGPYTLSTLKIIQQVNPTFKSCVSPTMAASPPAKCTTMGLSGNRYILI